MSTRQAVKSAKPARAAVPPAGAALTARLPLEYYRLIAAALLVGLLGISILAPLGPAPVAQARLMTPTLDGGGQPFDQVFDYRAPAELGTAGTPPRSALLRAAPDSQRFLAAIAGEIQRAQSPDSAATPARNDRLVENPQRWGDLETFYGGTMGGATGDFGFNGLGMVKLLRATQATGAQREGLIQEAINLFTPAWQARPNTWFYAYNLALAHIMLGNYGTATTLLDDVLRVDSSRPEVRFFRGLAALRTGEPAQAILSWNPLVSANDPDWGVLAGEGLRDADGARGNAEFAAQGYRQLLDTTPGLDWTLYDKLLRLEMGRGTTGAMLAMIDTMQGHVPDDIASLPRLLYDRGRILALTGQPGAAQAAFEQGLDMVPNEPAFHLALAQTLLASGNTRQALTEAEAALRAAGADPSAADFGPAIAGLTGDEGAQRRGRQVLGARAVQAAAWAAHGNTGALDAMGNGLATLATSDAARAGWYRLFAVQVAAAAGRVDAARAALGPALDAAGAPPAAPGKGAILNAFATLLTPAQAASEAGALLGRAGSSLATPAPALDGATAAFYAGLAAQLEAAGQANEAGPLYRAAAAWEQAVRAAKPTTPVAPTGVDAPIHYRSLEANYLLRKGDYRLAIARYRQLLAVEPTTAGAWTNIGIAYDRLGDAARARRGCELAVRLDPQNAQAQHNLGVLNYREFNLPGAEAAFGAANLAARTANHAWGYALVPAGGSLALPAPPPSADFWARIPALIALLLLLLHTLIPRRPQEDDPAVYRAPQAGLLGRLGAALPALGRNLAAPLSLALAVAVAGLAWAWAGSGNNPLIAVLLLGSGLLAALLALGGQELAQALAARREPRRGATTHQVAPLGLLLAVLTAPLGLVYGWQVVTRAGAAGAPPSDSAPDADEATPAPTPRPGARASTPARTPSAPTSTARPALVGWGALGPQARVALVGLLANALLTLLCLAGYLTLGWPVWRLALLANLAVLAFTAVSEPPAEGWHLWRRAPLLWLLLFIGAAAALTVFALGAA